MAIVAAFWYVSTVGWSHSQRQMLMVRWSVSYLVRVTAHVTADDKVGQHLICHRVNLVFHHAQDIKPAHMH